MTDMANHPPSNANESGQTKIAELVKIHRGYAKYVNLVADFGDPTENRWRMQHYMPIKSHREAFARLARALYPLEDRVYFLTGSYGTGKSHLCLMLANYLALKPTEPEMTAFFANWQQRDPTGAEKLRNLRGTGRYLVALGEYGGGDDFDSMMLRAVQAACARDGLQDIWLDTHYQEARRQIAHWEERQQRGGPSGIFHDFRAELGTRYPDWDLDSLKNDLAELNSEALQVFRDAYHAVLGQDFTYSKDNIVAILQDFLASDKFRERYRGLVIIADEFGYTLDRGNISIDVFQRFAEMCKDGVAGSELIFIGTGHKPFRAYSAGGLSSADFNVVEARIHEVPLASEELELIISAIVTPRKEHTVWQAEVAPQGSLFNKLALATTRLGAFKHLQGPEVRERIIENIYPMHPIATHCLIELSTEIGSNARSVFAFFAGAGETPVRGSYGWYVETQPVKQGERLNLYPADELVTYFAAELQPDNLEARQAVRGYVQNYRAALGEVRKQAQAELLEEVDPLVQRILRLILVYEISKLTATFDNLGVGLYGETPGEKARLQSRLNSLVENQVLFQTPQGVYEFREQGQHVDFQLLIEQYKAEPANVPEDIAAEVTTLVSLGRGGEFLEAKNHNQPYYEDKRVKRVFARPGDLAARQFHQPTGQEVDFFTYHELLLQAETVWKDRYEGVIIYVLCENADEITRARHAVEKNPSPRVIVGIPRHPLPIRAAVMNLRAALHLHQTADLDALSLQDRTRLQQDIIGDEKQQSGYTGAFVQIRQRYLDAQELSWYGVAGKVVVAQPHSAYEPADELMGRLYTHRNMVQSTYLNQIHLKSSKWGKDVPLHDAVAALLSTHRLVEIDHSAPENQGQIRYLRKVLADTGALHQVAPPQGNLGAYEVASDIAEFRAKLPALADLLDALYQLAAGQPLAVRQVLQQYAHAPYGQGPLALALFLAYAVRSLGDELRLQLQPGAWGYAALNNPDLIIEVVDHRHPNAVLTRQEIGAAARQLITDVYNLFAAEPGAAGQQHQIIEAHAALLAWWNDRPNLARTAEIYPPDSSAQALVELLRGADSLPAYNLILEQLQTIYGYPEEAVITTQSQADILAGLLQDKAHIEDAPRRVKEKLLPQLLAPFEPASDLYSDYQHAVERWYKHELNDEQRDEFSAWHSNASQAVVRGLRTVVNIETTFCERLPADAGFGLGKVDDWHRDRRAEYVKMFTAALACIAKHRVVVPVPVWEVKEGKQVETQGQIPHFQISFRTQVTLVVQPPAADVSVFVTNDNQDPCQAAQRLPVTGEKGAELVIESSRVVKLVSHSAAGQFSQVLTLSFTNKDEKYKPIPLSQQKLMQREYLFVYPEDRAALQVLLTNIMRMVIAEEVVNQDEARQLLEHLATEVDKLY